MITESEAILLAVQHLQLSQVRHAGLDRAVFVPTDDWFHPVTHDRPIWFVYFHMPDHLCLLGSPGNYYVVEVDCSTHETTLHNTL